MRLLLPLIVVAAIVLFFAGLIVPRRSKRLEAWIDRRLERGEEKGADSAGRLGDWTAKTLRLSRRASDRILESGRGVRAKLSR